MGLHEMGNHTPQWIAHPRTRFRRQGILLEQNVRFLQRVSVFMHEDRRLLMSIAERCTEQKLQRHSQI